MKVIAFAAVSGGGKTALVNAVKERLSRAAALYFDSYSFEGEPEDFYQWTIQGANYGVWNLEPLLADILAVRARGLCDYLLLDYPFGYCHEAIRGCIDCAIFIDTPLDIAMARRVLRDQGAASGPQIRADMEYYLKYGRVPYLQMLRDVLPLSDFLIDGTKSLAAEADEAIKIITAL